MPTALKLIAGLGNPGPQYAHTRHNVGADWVRELARAFQIPLTLDTKFKAEIGRGSVLGHDVRLLIPVTYMNHSGDAIGAVAHFYKWSPEQILVAHDEVAFALIYGELKRLTQYSVATNDPNVEVVLSKEAGQLPSRELGDQVQRLWQRNRDGLYASGLKLLANRTLLSAIGAVPV